MPSDDKKRLSSKRVMRSLLFSTGIGLAFLLFLEFSDNGCRIFKSGQAAAFISAGVVWLFLSALFLLPWWGRAVLLLLPLCVAIFILTTNIDHAGIAVVQASAVGRVRTLQGLLGAHREKHPSEGFPALLPMMEPTRFTEKYYKFEYTPIRAKQDSHAADYVLRATPLRPDCGCTMRLVTSSDGVIHWNFEDRPATKADPPLAP